jgi:hypothetical protein
MNVVELVFKDTNSAVNKDICAFVDEIMPKAVVVGRTHFKFRIVSESECEKLLDHGIREFPVMITSKDNFYGLKSIAVELNRYIDQSAEQPSFISEEEEVGQNMLDELRMGVQVQSDEKGTKMIAPKDDDIETMRDPTQRLQDAMAKRKNINSTLKGYNAGNTASAVDADRPSSTIGKQHGMAPSNLTQSDDIMAPLKSMSKAGDSAQDNDMMATLLAKLSDE